ncbi:MAG: DUF6411 family protein [Candidatus Limnocylindrales bacterium]
MVIGIVIGVCVVLIVLAFVIPRLSRHPERGAQKVAGTGGRAAGKAPGGIGRILRKPFSQSQRAMGKSARTGRKGRGKLPF